MLKSLRAVSGVFSTTQKAAEKVTGATKNVGKSAEKAGKGAEKASKGFGQFASSIARIFKYRMIRKVIREIGAALQEGLQNAYQFSKGIGGELAQALDSMATKSQTMKNQLGAAFGELLTTFMPIILRFIEVLRVAANAIAQFFAALGGRSTYLKAVDASKEWAENTASGAKSVKEMRRQLMGFDEINRLDSPNDGGGGGGGSNTQNYGGMFEESPIPEWLVNLGQRLNELKTTLLTIAGIIAGISLLRHIGQALGWGDAFDGVMKKLIGIAIAIAGAILLWDGFSDALNNGVDWGNLIEMLGGTILLVVGLGTAFGTTGAAIGLLVGGVVLCIAGIREWIQTGQASVPVLTAISVGVLAIGAAIALLTGSWIPLVIAGIGAAIVWIVGKWDWVKEKWASLWNGILNDLIDYVNAILDWIRPVLEGIDAIVGFFGGHSNLGDAHINNIPAPAAYATGGMPEDGLFFANHGELVGQFSNGSTAVANNEQIVEGIRRGVYDAVSSAMSNNRGSQDVRVYLDGKQISNAVTKQQRSLERTTGVSFA